MATEYKDSMITKFKNEYREVADVYTQATHHLASHWFTPAEIDAGAPALRASQWVARCRACRLFVYKVEGKVRGFVGLHDDGKIEGPYVHSGPRGLAVAQALLDHVTAVARDHGRDPFVVVADRTARDLFRGSGFVLQGPTLWNLGSLSMPAVELRKAAGRG